MNYLVTICGRQVVMHEDDLKQLEEAIEKLEKEWKDNKRL